MGNYLPTTATYQPRTDNGKLRLRLGLKTDNRQLTTENRQPTTKKKDRHC